MSRRLAIGIDIGGTKVAGGVVDEAGTILAPRPARHPAPLDDARRSSRTPSSSRSRSSRRSTAHDVAAVGIGAAGFVDADRATVRLRAAPVLAQRAAARRRCRQRVAPAGRRRQRRQRGRLGGVRASAPAAASRTSSCVTLGTGIGGALVVDGHVQRGRHGIAGEFGHMQVVPGGHRCECGNRGCWEQYASRQRARARGPRDDRGRVARRGRPARRVVGGDADALDGPVRSPRPPATATRLRVELLADIGRVARRRHRQPRCGLRPRPLRHRRRRQRGRRPAASARPARPSGGQLHRPRLPPRGAHRARRARHRGRPRRRRRPRPRAGR